MIEKMILLLNRIAAGVSFGSSHYWIPVHTRAHQSIVTIVDFNKEWTTNPFNQIVTISVSSLYTTTIAPTFPLAISEYTSNYQHDL